VGGGNTDNYTLRSFTIYTPLHMCTLLLWSNQWG